MSSSPLFLLLLGMKLYPPQIPSLPFKILKNWDLLCINLRVSCSSAINCKRTKK